jgi:hypothetical protein
VHLYTHTFNILQERFEQPSRRLGRERPSQPAHVSVSVCGGAGMTGISLACLRVCLSSKQSQSRAHTDTPARTSTHTHLKAPVTPNKGGCTANVNQPAFAPPPLHDYVHKTTRDKSLASRACVVACHTHAQAREALSSFSHTHQQHAKSHVLRMLRRGVLVVFCRQALLAAERSEALSSLSQASGPTLPKQV